MTTGARMAAAFLLLTVALAGCSGSTPLAPDRSWGAMTPAGHEGRAPAFPASVEGYRLVRGWTPQSTRAFIGHWSAVAGPDGSDGWLFPASQNGCGLRVFLVRWRVLSDLPVRMGTAVGAAPILDPTPAPGMQVTVSGTAGWATLSGCQSPIFTVPEASPDGGNLTDIAVEVQELEPTP